VIEHYGYCTIDLQHGQNANDKIMGNKSKVTTGKYVDYDYDRHFICDAKGHLLFVPQNLGYFVFELGQNALL
jgi:hypothetical protein